MGLKQKRKETRNIICGKGYCLCRNGKYVSGKGFVDLLKIRKEIGIVPPIGDIVKTSDSTKAIVQEIRNRRKPELQNIVERINQFKIGSGFAYV